MSLEKLKILGDCLIEDLVFFFLLGLMGENDMVLFEVVSWFGCFLSLSFGEILVLGGVFL